MQPNLSEFWLGRKSRLWILGIVAILALVAANAAWLFPTLDELGTNAYLLHRAIALDVRNQLSNFMGQQETDLTNAADILNQGSASPVEILSRLMKEDRPFESVTLLDAGGTEKFKTHRFLLITSADLKDRSSDPLFKALSAGQVYISPVVFSGI